MNIRTIKKIFSGRREQVRTGHRVTGKKVNPLLAKKLSGFFLITLLVGCEAPLNLQGVDRSLSEPIRRTDQFQAVVVNDHAVLAVGDDGLVISTPKKAMQWQRNQITGKPSFIDAVVCPDQTFALLDNKARVWFSSDNGDSWQVKATGTQESVLSIACSASNKLWITASFSTILSSTDKGDNWQQYSLDEDAQLTSIQFVGEQSVIVAGEFGLIVKSDDNGQSWQRAEYIPNEFYPQDIHFNNAQQGWVAGLGGQILYTEDGGNSWVRQMTPIESPLYSFQKLGGDLFVTGDHGNVLKLNSEQRWEKAASARMPVYLRDAVALNQNQLLVAGGWGSLFTVEVQ